MRKRDVFYVATFTAVACIGFINVATGGLMSYLAVEHSPYHSIDEPQIEIDQDELVLTEQNSLEIVLHSAERFTYSVDDIQNAGAISVDFRPDPAVTQESMPPTWIWGFPTPTVSADMSLDPEDFELGTYTYTVEASNSEGTVKESFNVTVE